jgi:hypothetical protein
VETLRLGPLRIVLKELEDKLEGGKLSGNGIQVFLGISYFSDEASDLN